MHWLSLSYLVLTRGRQATMWRPSFSGGKKINLDCPAEALYIGPAATILTAEIPELLFRFSPLRNSYLLQTGAFENNSGMLDGQILNSCSVLLAFLVRV
jgi:hypothetical protein